MESKRLHTLSIHAILQLSIALQEEKDLKAFVCTSLNMWHHVISRPLARDYTKALPHRLHDLAKRGNPTYQRFIITNSIAMQPQSKPWCFGVAFASLF